MTDIAPIPPLYWDGIQFYLPSVNDEGVSGYEVMYLTDGGQWAYQGWTEAPSEDCPIVKVAIAGESS